MAAALGRPGDWDWDDLHCDAADYAAPSAPAPAWGLEKQSELMLERRPLLLLKCNAAVTAAAPLRRCCRRSAAAVVAVMLRLR
jgi:hypothetical protein